MKKNVEGRLPEGAVCVMTGDHLSVENADSLIPGQKSENLHSHFDVLIFKHHKAGADGEMERACLVLTGEGWNTRTSMPWCLTSTARLAPKEDMKLFVAAYSAVNGEAIDAAALDVNTMHPLSFLATYGDQMQNGKSAVVSTIIWWHGHPDVVTELIRGCGRKSRGFLTILARK